MALVIDRMTISRASSSIGIGESTVLRWRSNCRDTVAKALGLSQYKFFGTTESPVQVDESYFSGQRKN